MKKFVVSTTEILSRLDVIEAESEEDALRKANAMWSDEKIVLTGEDFQDLQMEIEKMITVEEAEKDIAMRG